MLKARASSRQSHGLQLVYELRLHLVCSQLFCMIYSICWHKQRPPHLHPRFCERCSKWNTSWMLLWFHSGVVAGLVWCFSCFTVHFSIQ